VHNLFIFTLWTVMIRTFPDLDIFIVTAQIRFLVALFELILLFLNTSLIPSWCFLLLFSLLHHNLLILLQSIICLCKWLHFVLRNLSENHEVMKLLIWLFWSANNLCPLCYEVYIGVGLTSFLCVYFVSASPFLLHFLRFIRFCISNIWMDKSSSLNHSFFYSQTKTNKLALQLSPHLFFFAVIHNSFRND